MVHDLLKQKFRQVGCKECLSQEMSFVFFSMTLVEKTE